MPRLSRRVLCAALVVLAACSTPQARTRVVPNERLGGSRDVRAVREHDDSDRVAMNRARLWIQASDVERFKAAERLIAEAETVKLQVRAARGDGNRPPATVSASLSQIMACIRAHESGNYQEHSHPDGGGSGAYQYLRSTWAVWSARAGYPGYPYPYEAPASVQDAVTAFVLSHGGAHNWDPSYGNDPCTVGLQ